MNMLVQGKSATLADAMWHTDGQTNYLRAVVLMLVGTALLTLSAKIHVPFWPVPMTMQTFAVLVIAMVYGPVLGTATVALYLAEGAFGLPVFSGTPERGIGLAYMAGPTGGYLAGFLMSAALLGWLNSRGWDRRFSTALAAMVLGTAVILLLGFAWLSVLIGAEKALQFGIVPFLPGAALKIALAAALLPLAWRFIRRHDR